MRAQSPSFAALALASLYTRDPTLVEQQFECLTPPHLRDLDAAITEEQANIISALRGDGSETNESLSSSILEDERNQVLARAMIRRVVYKCLKKYDQIHSRETMNGALKYHKLPAKLQERLVAKFGGKPPMTWFECLEQLKKISEETKQNLWQLVLDHEMTSYVPVQCQFCGRHVIKDIYSSTQDDDQMGLSVESLDGSELGARGGWFRGKPHPASSVFVIDCPICERKSRWYRSGHPQIILNPNNWGRLCGEQEELRLNLANYLGVSIRTCVPLDWDHIWSEYRDNTVDSKGEGTWNVHDDSARNFAVRLDEGIGTWTRVLAISRDPNFCCDVTDEYLSCFKTKCNGTGRADARHAPNMSRYRSQVLEANMDKDASMTQAKTLNGFVLHRANWAAEDVTRELKDAAKDYLSYSKAWWQ